MSVGSLEAGTALALYRGLCEALSPAATFLLKRRAARGKEDSHRLAERRGHASRSRPRATLIWVHAASVGESLAALPLVSALLAKPGRSVLMTTGTLASARLMAERLPDGAFHQFVPVDVPSCVRRFLDHWRPDLALFIESELWPNLVLETRARAIPMALVNARLSRKSFERWRYAPALGRRLVGAFDACLAQDEEVASRLRVLGAASVVIAGNLKADAPDLPVDEAALSAFRQAMRGRPMFLAASTHDGEETLLFPLVLALRPMGALTVIVPRHPPRGGDIEKAAKTYGLNAIRRSASALPDADTELYIADTLGELGLFYRAAPFAFLGGSLVRHGGQNPLEPARLGTAVLCGPYTDNFAEIFRVLLAAQGEGRVETAEQLAALVKRWIAEPLLAVRAGLSAKAAAQSLSGALDKSVAAAERLLRHARA